MSPIMAHLTMASACSGTASRTTLRDDLPAARRPRRAAILNELFPDRAPVVNVHDAATHAMAWLGSALRMPSVPLGVDAFGESGSLRDLYEIHHLMPGSIVNAALAALTL